MRLQQIFALTLCAASVALTGCVDTVDGRHRAGMPFQRDRIERRFPRSPAEVFAAARDVMKYHGTITSEDTVRNSIQGSVDERRIWIAVEPVDNAMSRAIVQARTKGGFADLEMAAYLETEIAVRLASGNVSTTPRR